MACVRPMLQQSVLEGLYPVGKAYDGAVCVGLCWSREKACEGRSGREELLRNGYNFHFPSPVTMGRGREEEVGNEAVKFSLGRR